MTLSRLCGLTALLTLVLITVGGAVHATQSSLACPDWPLCHGEVFPDMVGGVAWEHGHRLLGLSVGLLTVLIAVRVWRRERGRARWLGPGLLGLVGVQAVLGGITVIYRLPTLVSTAHLAISLLFVVTLVYLGWRSSGAGRVAVRPDVARWLSGAAVAVYLQCVLGALVRHTGAGVACGTDGLLCAGYLWPGWAPGRLQVVHRIAALAVTVVVALAAARVLRAGPALSRLRPIAVSCVVLVLLQVALGVASVVTALGVAVVTAHLTVAAALLLSLVWMRLSVDPTRAPATAAVKDLSPALDG